MVLFEVVRSLAFFLLCNPTWKPDMSDGNLPLCDVVPLIPDPSTLAARASWANMPSSSVRLSSSSRRFRRNSNGFLNCSELVGNS